MYGITIDKWQLTHYYYKYKLKLINKNKRRYKLSLDPLGIFGYFTLAIHKKDIKTFKIDYDLLFNKNVNECYKPYTETIIRKYLSSNCLKKYSTYNTYYALEILEIKNF